MILQGKRALVTGGALRIGKMLTQTLQSAGVEVVVHYRHSKAEAEALSPFTVQADLQQLKDCAALIEQAGPLDVLINNASIFTKERLAETNPSRMLREFNINLFAPMELMRAFAAQTSGGGVINLLDRRIACNDASCVPYSLSKKGLAALTQLAAVEYAPQITVNALALGPILPPSGSSIENAYEQAGKIPLEQLPVPEDVAKTMLFLLEADSITGQIIYLDGGQHLLGNGV